jgi:c-di-AMP phosphodiesterase-like protein
MKKWYHEFERLVDKLIPFLLIILLNIIIMELFFHEAALEYHLMILIADSFIITVFVADLIFKYLSVRDIPLFIKKYWIDILAVFPFFLVFRIFEAAGLLGGGADTVAATQKILHEGVEVEKEGVKIVKEGAQIEKEVARGMQEAERLAKATRAQRITRFIRPLSRAPRLAKALHFYEAPRRHEHRVAGH